MLRRLLRSRYWMHFGVDLAKAVTSKTAMWRLNIDGRKGSTSELPAMASDLVKQRVCAYRGDGRHLYRLARPWTPRQRSPFFLSAASIRFNSASSKVSAVLPVTSRVCSVFTTELMLKRFQLLHDILPSVKSCALLVNPNSVGCRYRDHRSSKAYLRVSD